MKLTDILTKLAYPAQEELFARSPNKLKTYAKSTTKDAEIAALNWLHIDLDPVRPPHSSATEEERQAAEKRARRITKFLAENYDMNNPIHSCSGNGYNLDYYLGGIENNDSNKLLLKNSINALSILFSDNKVEVDKTTYNPSRIIKAFGCKTFKGKDTDERPHCKNRDGTALRGRDYITNSSKVPNTPQPIEPLAKDGSRRYSRIADG